MTIAQFLIVDQLIFFRFQGNFIVLDEQFKEVPTEYVNVMHEKMPF